MSKRIDDLTKLVTGDFKTLFPKLILPMLTLIGALGGFPAPPKSFQFLADNKFFQYFFLWVLVMQGGGSVDADLSLVAVLLFVLVIEGIKFFEKRAENENE